MKLQDAIEFAIRESGGGMPPEKILERLLQVGLVTTDQEVTTHRVAFMASAEPEMFILNEDGKLDLTHRRKNDRTKLFRQRCRELSHTLRGVPTGYTGYLTAILIHSLVARRKNEAPLLTALGPVPRSELLGIIDALIVRYPTAMKPVERVLRDMSFLTKALASENLMLAAQVIPDSLDVIKTAREYLSWLRGGRFDVPWDLSTFMVDLLAEDVQSAPYDPYASSGLLTALAGRMQTVEQGHNFHMHGFCQDAGLHMILELELDLLGHKSEVIEGTPFDHQVTQAEQVAHFDYGYAICAPPFETVKDEATGTRVRACWLYLDHIISALGEGGRAAVLVPLGALTAADARSRRARERLIREDILEAVVHLPQGAFKPSTAAEVAVLVLDKSKTRKWAGGCCMVSMRIAGGDIWRNPRRLHLLTEEVLGLLRGEWTTVMDRFVWTTGATIAKADYDLTPFRYLDWTGDVIIELKQEGRNLVRLKEVLHARAGFRSLPASRSEDLNDNPLPPLFIRIKDLAHDTARPYLNLPEREGNRIFGPITVVDGEAVLVSRQFKRPYPTIVPPGNPTIAIPPSIIALRPDVSKMLPEYLVHEMQQPYFQKQVESISRGAAITQFKLADLMETWVELRPIEEQRRLVERERDMFRVLDVLSPEGPLDIDLVAGSILAVLKTNGFSGDEARFSDAIIALMELVQKRSRDEYAAEVQNNLSMLRHQFNNRLAWVQSGINVLQGYIQGLAEQGIIDPSQPIAPSFEGDDAPVAAVQDSITQLLANAAALPDMLDHVISTMGLTATNLVSLDLDEFMRKEILPLYSGDNRFRLQYDGLPPESNSPVKADTAKLKHAIVNIVDNAVKHGFVTGHAHNIVIQCSVDEDVLGVIIVNDGIKPDLSLSEMVQRGRKSKSSTGTGDGLYWSDKFMREMGGSLEQLTHLDDYHLAVFGVQPTFGLHLLLRKA